MREEPFRPAWCSGRLEEGIRVGLKTMLKSKKSDKKTGASRSTQRRGKAMRITYWMRSKLAWSAECQRDKCCTRTMWICCLEAPTETLRSLYRELERWTFFVKESWTVNEWVREKLIGHSYTLQEKEREKVRKGFLFQPGAAGFLHWWCQHQLRGPDKLQSLFFLYPDQADGSRIQLLNDDQGVMVLSTEQDG